MYSMYGHQIAQADDDYVKLAEEAIHSVLDSVSPGLMAVNALPIRMCLDLFNVTAPHILSRNFSSVSPSVVPRRRIPRTRSKMFENNKKYAGCTI